MRLRSLYFSKKFFSFKRRTLLAACLELDSQPRSMARFRCFRRKIEPTAGAPVRCLTSLILAAARVPDFKRGIRDQPVQAQLENGWIVEEALLIAGGLRLGLMKRFSNRLGEEAGQLSEEGHFA